MDPPKAPTLRPGRLSDAAPLGDIVHRAFRTIATRHGFEPDFPDAATASASLGALLGHPRFWSRVAEVEGRAVGSNFMDERGPVFGIGPITVDPAVQDRGVGRQLMAAALDRAEDRQAPGVRLVQSAYHARSLALYTKLGFQARELLACLRGPPLQRALPGRTVRPAALGDLGAMDELAARAHGHHRHGEAQDAIHGGTALVVEHGGAVTGYASGIGFFHHMVGESNADLQALFGAGRAIEGPGVLVPAGNGELYAWLLEQGWRTTQAMTLMSRGMYQRPERPWVASILY